MLAGSGHIAGVVNPPAAGKYQYWVNDKYVATRAALTAGLVAFQVARSKSIGGLPRAERFARLALTVARQLKASGANRAAVSLCIGVGQGLAVILERVR